MKYIQIFIKGKEASSYTLCIVQDDMLSLPSQTPAPPTYNPSWEAEIGRILVQGQPEQIVHETPSPSVQGQPEHMRLCLQ
jgi:hypothetical protein